MAKTARQKIVAKLDKIVSEIVIKRDLRCVVCGRGYQRKPGHRLGSGHVFSRKAFSTRWDVSREGNVHCQCWPCNRRHVWDRYDYFNWYMEKFGKDEFDKLRRRYKSTVKWSTPELEQLYENLKTIKEEMEKKGEIIKQPNNEGKRNNK